MMKRRSKQKIYGVTLCLGMVSVAISMLLITWILKDNSYLLIDPARDLYQLEILDNQKLILQIISIFPTLIFILNVVVCIWLFRDQESRNLKSLKWSVGWIMTSVVYQILTFLSARYGISSEFITIPFMAGTWILKAVTFFFLMKELRTERKSVKGALCVN